MTNTIWEHLTNTLHEHQSAIYDWLREKELNEELPLYTSVDVRDAGFKISVVDTNLFPAGFNNLCELGIHDAGIILHKEVIKRVSGCKNILLITEEHTRNTWYLENIKVLMDIINAAGFNVIMASFLTTNPDGCDKADYIEVQTALGNTLKMYCLRNILNLMKAGTLSFDLVLLNNDLSAGIPNILKEIHIPVYPSMQAGWHSRQKSCHFTCANHLIEDLCKKIGLDPWQLSCFHATATDVTVNEDEDRKKLADMASDLFKKIQAKYDEYAIKEKPFIFLKSDFGTYGMGVLAVEDPSEIIDFNRKTKNKLYKGKSAIVINRFILQEGVPSITKIGDQTSEPCLYQIANHYIGGFYRVNQKSDRDNLNSPGMHFVKMCAAPYSAVRCDTKTEYADDATKNTPCGVTPASRLDIYQILARIAGIAAHREIQHLEAVANKNAV